MIAGHLQEKHGIYYIVLGSGTRRGSPLTFL